MVIKNRFKQFLTRKLVALIAETEREKSQKTLSRFANNPRNTKIDLPYRIVNPEHIHMGDDVYLGPGSLLVATTRYPGPEMHPPPSVVTQTFTAKITIGNRVSSTGGLQVAALEEITIEDDVLFATNVNITDGLHGYQSANVPYKYQPMWRLAPIIIKKGCWIGQNVVILPGVTIGEFTIIGANSVVTKSIPDRSIAVGSPACVIKRWDDKRACWRPVKPAERTEEAR